MTDGGLGRASDERSWEETSEETNFYSRPQSCPALLAARGRGRRLSGPGGSGDENELFPANQKLQLSNIFPPGGGGGLPYETDGDARRLF